MKQHGEGIKIDMEEEQATGGAFHMQMNMDHTAPGMQTNADQTASGIQGNMGYTGNSFAEMEADLCKRCRVRRIDRSENPQSVLCRECREELIKLKIPPAILAVSGIVAVLVAVCVGLLVVQFRSYDWDAISSRRRSANYISHSDDSVIDSSGGGGMADSTDNNSGITDSADDNGSAGGIDGSGNGNGTNSLKVHNTDSDADPASESDIQAYAAMADSGYVITAMDRMLDELEQNPANLQLAIMLTDIAMEHYYSDYAAYTINTYIQFDHLSDDEYEKITAYVDELNIYYDTCDLIMNLWASYFPEEAGDDIDIETGLSAIHDALGAYLGDEKYDQSLLYYYIAYVCQDEEERIQHLEDCIALNPNNYDAQGQLGVCYRSQGDLKKARTILTQAYARNCENPTLLRALATLELAEGNTEDGLSFAKAAYDIYADGDYVVDTYLIALAANGQKEEAQRLIAEWEEQGYVFDDDFYAFQEGAMTLEEYYIGD